MRRVVDIGIPSIVTPGLVSSIERLLPELTDTAPPITKEIVESIINHNVFLTAKIDDTIVGMLTLTITTLPSGLRARIEDVVVDPAYQGQGIGHQLNERAIEIASSLNVKSLDLTSRPTRSTDKFYTALGFEQRDTGVYRYNKQRGHDNG